MLRTICKRFGIRIYIPKITITVKIGCKSGSCSTGFARKSIFKERRKFFSRTIFHAERDFADFFYRFFCGKNVFAKE